MDLNGLCNSPKGTMHILGIGRSTKYSFKIVREGPSGRTMTPLPVEGEKFKAPIAQVALMVPGPGNRRAAA